MSPSRAAAIERKLQEISALINEMDGTAKRISELLARKEIIKKLETNE